MTRDDGWRFLSLGRHLERLAFVATTLEACWRRTKSADPALLEWLLELSDSLLTFAAPHAASPSGRRSSICCCSTSAIHDRCSSSSAKLAKHVRLLPGRGPRGDGRRRNRSSGCAARSIGGRASCSASDLARRAARRTASVRASRLSDASDAAVFQPRLRAAARDGRAMTEVSDRRATGSGALSSGRRLSDRARDAVRARRAASSTSQHVACLDAARAAAPARPLA